jgi:uncharacterized membrane protein YjfL (UPF0719 family)
VAAVPEVPLPGGGATPSAGAPSPEAASPEAASPEAIEATRGLIRFGRILAAALLVSPLARAVFERQPRSSLAVGALYVAVGAAAWAAVVFAQGRLLFGRALRRHVARGNGAAAIATAANQIALGLMLSRAVTGDAIAELPAALAFAGLAVVTWAVFVALFRMVTSYPDGQEIAGENQAAAVSYAGVALALAVIVAHAVDGPFSGWARSLGAYAAALATAVALYPVRQLVVEGLLLGKRPRLRGGELDRAIGQRRSVAVAAVEAVAYLATAWLATGLS